MQRNILLMNHGFKDINPLVCGEQVCAPGHFFGPASRPYYLLHYVISGQGIFEKDKTVYPVTAGQIFVIRPYEITYYQADTFNPWHYCWVGFESELDLSDTFASAVINAREYMNLFQQLRDCEWLENSREFYISSKIYELIALINQRGHAGEDSAYRYVMQAKNYIEANYVNEISVAQIAGYMNLNRSYLCVIFKEYLGRSPQQYLIDFRLNKAAELIALHGYRVGEAAASTGYPDLCNFSRMFKRRFGVSPAQYKESATEPRKIIHDDKQN